MELGSLFRKLQHSQHRVRRMGSGEGVYGLRQNQAEGRQRDKDDYGISSPANPMIMIYVGTGKTWRTLKKETPD